MDPQQAREAAQVIGGIGGLLTIGVPVLLWLALLRPWKPRTRLSFALRLSLWPLIVLSNGLGGPIARAIAGHSSPYEQSAGSAFLGLLGVWILTGPIAFTIGWVIGAKRFPLHSVPSSAPN